MTKERKDFSQFSRIAVLLMALALVPVQFGCSAEGQGVGTGAQLSGAGGAPADLAEKVSIDVREAGREFQTVFKFYEPFANPPMSGRINFPASFFDGFADGGIKSFFGLVGIFSFNQMTGLPLLLGDNTHAFFNALPPVNFEVQGNSLLISTSSVGLIGASDYTMSFFPGVFNLDPGAYNLEMIATWPDASTFTFHKLLLISAAVVPHFAVGRAGAIDVGSVFVVNNAGQDAVTLNVQFFLPEGSPFQLELEGEAGSVFQVEVPAQGSAILEVDSMNEDDPVRTGWALFQGTAPFQVSSIFANSDAGADNIRTAAGIAASSLATHHVLAVGKSLEGLNTAFAIVNPTNAEASMRLVLESPFSERGMEMPSHSQTAVFADAFFGVEEVPEIGSVVKIYSDTDVGVMALLTLNGEQIASLPSGTNLE